MPERVELALARGAVEVVARHTRHLAPQLTVSNDLAPSTRLDGPIPKRLPFLKDDVPHTTSPKAPDASVTIAFIDARVG